MSWNLVLGILSTIALLTPVVIIIVFRLYRNLSLLALGIYYVLAAYYNLLTEDFIPASEELVRYTGIITNLLDTPLMLGFLIFFGHSQTIRQRLRILTGIVIVYELVLVVIFGLSIDTIVYSLGPGIMFCLFTSSMFFFRQVSLAILHSKALGKALMAASVLFSYGGFSFIYILYYIMQTPHVSDSFLVYFLITICAAMLMSAGLLLERRRFQKLSELRVTRRELSDIFGDQYRKAEDKTALARNPLR